MYDNINTYYKDTNIFINELSAKTVLKLLKREEESHPLSAEKYAYMSKAYVFIQDDIMAQKYARKAIRADRNYPYGYIRLAFSYARMGKKRQTLKFTRIADSFDLSNNSFLLSFIAALYLYCEEESLAENVLDKLQKIPTKGADYYFNFGFLYGRENPEKALKYFKKALELNYKDTYKLWSWLADSYKDIEDYKNAELYADKCLLCGESYDTLDIKAECLNKNGYELEAVKYLKKQYKLCKSEDDKTLCLSKIIYNYSLAKKTKRCEKLIQLALKNFEPTSALYFVAANYYETAEEYEKAIDMYLHIIETDPENTTANNGLSFCYSRLNKNELALEYGQKALDSDPKDSYNYYRLGRIYINLKQYDKALENLLIAAEFDNTDVDTLQWISYCYSLTENFDKSLEFANRAILLDKTDCYSYFRKAWVYQETQKYKEAIKYYEECIKYNDKYIDAYLNISYIYSQLRDMKQSLLYANKALLINKDYAYAHYRKAWVFQESGKFEEAIDGYSKAIELDPTDIYNYLGIACVSLNSNENAHALLYANKALFIDRNCGGAYYYKSLALSNLGKQKEAEKAFAQAIKLGYTPG